MIFGVLWLWAIGVTGAASVGEWEVLARADVDGDAHMDALVWETPASSGAYGRQIQLRRAGPNGRDSVVFDHQAFRCWFTSQRVHGWLAIDCIDRLGDLPTYVVQRWRWNGHSFGGEFDFMDRSAAACERVKLVTRAEIHAVPARRVRIARPVPSGWKILNESPPVVRAVPRGAIFEAYGSVTDRQGQRWIEIETRRWILAARARCLSGD